MVDVEQWAEVRRMKRVEGLVGAGVQLAGLGWRGTRFRGCWCRRRRRAIHGRGQSRFWICSRSWICEQLQGDPKVPSQRLRELAVEIGYAGGKTIFDAYVREVRPRFLVKRTFQRTIYRPAELVQCDLWEPSRARTGWLWADASWVGRHDAVVLVTGVRRHSGVQQGGAGHPRWVGALDLAAGCAPGEAGLGPRVSDRRRESRACRSCRSAASWRSAGSSSMLVMLRRRGSSSVSTASCARTSSHAGSSQTTWTSRTSWTAGLRRPTAARTARSAVSRPSGWPRSVSSAHSAE